MAKFLKEKKRENLAVLAKTGRNEVRWCPGQEASLAPPCSKLRSFGSKRTVWKEVLVTLLGLFGDPE